MKKLEGILAKKHWNEVFENFEETSEWKHKTVKDIRGGFWYSLKDKCYIAFDAVCDYTIEEFDSKKEASKYAKGIMAITWDGIKI